MENEAGTVPLALALFGALLSVLPLLLLLAGKEIRAYRAGLMALSWFRRWDERQNRLLPGPAVTIGLALGAVSVALTLALGKAFIPQFSLASKPTSQLTLYLQVSFIYAGMLEEFAKAVLCLLGIFIVCRAAPGSPKPILSSAPFLCGAVGLGFALVENVSYLMETPRSHFLSMLLARGGISAVVHTSLNFLFGLALTRLDRRELLGGILVWGLLAALLHGAFDFFAFSPEPLPAFLALVLLAVVAGATLGWMYRVLPQAQFSPWQPVEKTEALPQTTGAADPGLLLALVRDPYATQRPVMHPPPFWPEDYPLPLGLRGRLFREDGACTPPHDLADGWSRYQTNLLQAAAQHGFCYRLFDSAVFAEAPQASYQQLSTLGIDLTQVVPLRIIELGPDFDPEYRPIEPKSTPALAAADRYIYTTMGLADLYGREMWISFPHIFPGLRLFLLNLAAGAGGAEGLPDFRVVRMHPLALGDLTGAYRGFVVLPLLDPLREVFMERRMPGMPAEILFLTERDLELVSEHGVPVLLGALKRAGLAWANDYRRTAAMT